MKYIIGKRNKKKLRYIGKIYEKSEHKIPRELIDRKVINILRTLQRAGFVSYVVGGAIRDILVGKRPKDFDLVTNAVPKQICRLFRRARIIGKRFTIVLIPVGRNESVEISTFRSLNLDDNKNFGSIYEDVYRRDFSCNSLYYCPFRQVVLDFVDGMAHIRSGKLVPVYRYYSEDPVRILRAVKLSVQTRLSLSFFNRLLLVFYRKKLLGVSNSRKTEEFSKIMMMADSAEVIEQCFSQCLLQYITPNLHRWFREKKERLATYLNDQGKVSFHDKDDNGRRRVLGLQALLRHFIIEKRNERPVSLLVHIKQVKDLLYPLTLPNMELKTAIKSVLTRLAPVSRRVDRRSKGVKKLSS